MGSLDVVSDVPALVVAPGETWSVTRDLLDDRMVLAEGVSPSVPGLRLAAADVSAGDARAQVELAAAFLALIRTRVSNDVGRVIAQPLVENRGVRDLHDAQ